MALGFATTGLNITSCCSWQTGKKKQIVIPARNLFILLTGFFFYAWGHARIPAQYDYISWMLHMSFYVLCGGIVGLVLKEWNNAGRRPVTVLSLGCVVIIVAANIVGIGMAN